MFCDEMFCNQAPNYAFKWSNRSEAGDILMEGFVIANLNDQSEITLFQVFYKPDKVPTEKIKRAKKCPFVHTLD